MQLTVVRKIILGFALFGCLLLLTSILSYFGLNEIRQSAVDVVEQKMPVQSKMVDVKTDILSLSTITANGYHENTQEGLQANRDQFDSLASSFKSDIELLSAQLKNNDIVRSAVKASDEYVARSHDMYEAISGRLALEKAIEKKLADVLLAADEASALMLDLSYLESDDPGVETLIGAGTNVDNKLLTMNTAIKELAETSDETVTQNIADDLDYQLSNLQVDKDYLNRLAETIDDGGTVANFNTQYDSLISQLTADDGLIALQKQKLEMLRQGNTNRATANEALSVALKDINTLFENVSEATLEGQTAILSTVQDNLVKNVAVSVIGLLAAFVLGTIATRSIARPLARINHGLSQLSKGDLTRKLDESGNDEFAALAAKVNSLTESLRELVGNILEQEIQLAAVTKETVSMGEKSLTQVDKQREQISVTSSNTKNVQDTSRSNLGQINVAMEALNEVAMQSADIGRLVESNRKQVANQASQAETSAAIIHRLDENSRSIGSILDVIKTIAEQTNLLALNAAIEAARAGEQGRGFAVVADEVRTLANRTHDSTEEIESMINSLQQDAHQAVDAINIGREQAQEGVKLTEQVALQVESIAAIISKLSDINQHIVTDTQHQDRLLGDVVSSLNTIVDLAEASAQSTRAANDSSMRIDHQMESLKKAVERFRLH